MNARVVLCIEMSFGSVCFRSGVVVAWLVSMAGCHGPNSDVQSTYSSQATLEERYPSDTYTMANINITYEDEHGEIYTEMSEVSCIVI